VCEKKTPGWYRVVPSAMHQAWDWRGDIQRHVETLKDSQVKMLGNGFGGGGGGGGGGSGGGGGGGGYPLANASGEPLQR